MSKLHRLIIGSIAVTVGVTLLFSALGGAFFVALICGVLAGGGLLVGALAFKYISKRFLNEPDDAEIEDALRMLEQYANNEKSH
jgi:hypothetical protein